MDSAQGTPAIQALQLSKFYGSFAAIREVSFEVPRGQVAAFLGPNGAGKSTTLKILTGYLRASEGTARIAGLDISQDRIGAASKIGYLPENGPLYPQMTPLELLRFFGEARGLADGRLASRIDSVVAQCNLSAVLEKSIHKLSKGYRQRVGMAQVLLHEPEILIMDEPTAGLDPNQIREVRTLIRHLSATKTVLLSTHILQEVEAVAEHVVIINEGRIVFDGTPAEMAGGEGLDAAFRRLTQPPAGAPPAEPPGGTAPAQEPEPPGEAAAAAPEAGGEKVLSENETVAHEDEAAAAASKAGGEA